ncbi:MAG: Rieske 2Fe-2S domain-containing protein [Alphaproteobacteria bacterium]|nr:Rieske 2Fe-2S domain-containing protein [Alphaproteobacteria bacterium]
MQRVSNLKDELEFNKAALTNVAAAIEHAHGLPNECYVGQSAFAHERERIFTQGWVCAGFAKDVPEPGGLFPFEFAGMPLLMVRGGDSIVRVFHNVCRHRGRILVDAPGTVKKAIACPYHRWTYSLDGDLTGTPHIGGPGAHSCPGFDKENVRLREVRSAEWFGLVFVDLSEAAEDFEAYISPIADRWRPFNDVPLVHTGADCTIEFALDCNWKLAVENYCEAYHLPWVHPGLNRYSPLEQHRNIVSARYSGQQSTCYAPNLSETSPGFPNAPDLPSFWETGAEYISLFPNVLLGLHRDHFYAALIQPDGPSRTVERFEIFYFDEAVRTEQFAAARADNRALWKSVFAEDRDAVEGMQRGRHSPGFDGGVFSPAMDPPTHAFHVWVANAMLGGRNENRAAAE